MKNITIGTKLTLSFSTIVILTLALGILLFKDIKKLEQEYIILYERGAVPLGLLVKTAEQAILMQLLARDLRLAKAPEERNEIMKVIEGCHNTLKDVINKQIELAIKDDTKVSLKSALDAVDKYAIEMWAMTNSLNQGGPNVYPESASKAADEVVRIGNMIIGQKVKETEDLEKENSELAGRSLIIALVALVIILFVSIAIDLHLTHSIRKILRELHDNANTLGSASEELSSVSHSLASGADETVNQANNVSGTAKEMSANINAMAIGAEQASANANEVAGAAEEMSTNMNTIASAIEEMSASISQIANNTGDVLKVASDATAKSSEATVVMGKLGAAAKEIGQVTDVIKKIADKTNLLALNATIEAASAGAAGKGFAVVAGEIKELANQSAKSADDIAHRIESIQSGTSDAVMVIRDVSDIIGKINESVESIVSNVGQQTKASNEIASNVAHANTGAKRVASAISEVAKGANDVSRNSGEAAKGANNVSQSVSGMSRVAKENSHSAGQVSKNAAYLSNISGHLKQLVDQFKV